MAASPSLCRNMPASTRGFAGLSDCARRSAARSSRSWSIESTSNTTCATWWTSCATAAGSDRGVRAPRASGYSELRAKKSSISGTTAYLHLGGIGNGSIGMGQSGWGKSRVRQPSAIMRRRLCAERCRVQRIARGPHAAQVDCVRYLTAVEILRFPATEHVSRPECSRESRWVRMREGFISAARVRRTAGDAGANPMQRLVEDLRPQASASRRRRRSTGIQPQLRHESN